MAGDYPGETPTRWRTPRGETTLEETLASLGVTELLVCGMMTRNCGAHTAISKSAEQYRVSILTGCTTVNELIHNIALHAVSTPVPLVPRGDLLYLFRSCGRLGRNARDTENRIQWAWLNEIKQGNKCHSSSTTTISADTNPC